MASQVKVILLDIEGTVCPLSFVREILFPYALQSLTLTLDSRWEDSEFTPYRDAFPEEYRKSKSAFIAHVTDLMARDVKVSYLKNLQGYLWESGYKSGEIKAPLFKDVASKFTSWIGQGQRIMIYSSGSVAAQKLFFKYTDATLADLTPVITDYFDTVNAGPKQDAASYKKIIGKYKYEPSEWLFLSDNVKEVEAAKQAGMQSIVVQREGNNPLPKGVEEKHRVISSFDELA